MVLGNPLMVGGGSPKASIFAYGQLAQTDTVKCFKSSLPAGYVPLTYIESTGTQWIDTGIKPTNNYQFRFKAIPTDFTNYGYLYGTNPTQRGCCCNYGSNYKFSFMYNTSWFGGENVDVINGDFFVDKNIAYKNGIEYARTGSSTFQSAYNLFLFAMNNYGAGNFGKYQLPYFEIDVNNAPARNFIPCLRLSDGEVGLYDLCGSASPFDGTPFYGNSGTGKFVAGPVNYGAELEGTWTSKTIQGVSVNGFDFAPLTQLGDYIIEANNGSKTIYKSVVVDTITNYDVEMNYILYLYNAGNEYGHNYYSTGGGLSVAKNASNMVITRNGSWAFISSTDKIQMEGYSAIKMQYNSLSGGYGYGATLRISTDGGDSGMVGYVNSSETSATIFIDISGLDSSYYVLISVTGATMGNFTVTKVWLE